MYAKFCWFHTCEVQLHFIRFSLLYKARETHWIYCVSTAWDTNIHSYCFVGWWKHQKQSRRSTTLMTSWLQKSARLVEDKCCYVCFWWSVTGLWLSILWVLSSSRQLLITGVRWTKGISGIVLDITQRKLLYQKRKETEQWSIVNVWCTHLIPVPLFPRNIVYQTNLRQHGTRPNSAKQ